MDKNMEYLSSLGNYQISMTLETLKVLFINYKQQMPPTRKRINRRDWTIPIVKRADGRLFFDKPIYMKRSITSRQLMQKCFKKTLGMRKTYFQKQGIRISAIEKKLKESNDLMNEMDATEEETPSAEDKELQDFLKMHGIEDEDISKNVDPTKLDNSKIENATYFDVSLGMVKKQQFYELRAKNETYTTAVGICWPFSGSGSPKSKL